MAPLTLPRRAGERPLLIAHRGDSIHHPENTLAAFAAAAEAGADLVELDVRLTADGAAVVLHDQDLSRTTDLAGPVHARTLEEVKRADASGGRGPRQEIPTLAEVLALLGPTDTGVDIEVKNLPGEVGFDASREAALEAALEALADAAFANPVLVTSFNPVTVRRCRELAPRVPTGLLTFASGDLDAALRLAAEAGHAILLPHAVPLAEAGTELVAKAHALGVAIGVWTVDDEEAMRAFFSRGVDALATNDPRLGVAVRDRLGSPP
jgi:glycerophosphoryl diester phosphodiesterase